MGVKPVISRLIELLNLRAAALIIPVCAGVLALAGLSADEYGLPVFSSGAFISLIVVLCLSIAAALVGRLKDFGPGSGRRGGAFVLHLGILVALSGAAVNSRLSKVSLIEITEGQTLPVAEGISVSLEKFHAFYKPGRFHKGEAAGLVFLENGAPRRALVHVNHPARAGGASVMLDKHGFAPLIRVTSPSGMALIDAFVSLKTDIGKSVSYQRSVNIPGTAKWLRLDFKPSPHGPFATNPSIKAALVEGGKIMAEGVVRPGRPGVLGGYKVSFDEVRYWANLQIRKDPALALVYAGFFIAVAGAFMCFWRILWA